MKITYDHQIFSWQEYGGISRYFFELANHLAAYRTNDVSVIAPLFVNRYLKNSSAHLKVHGKPIPRLRWTGRIRRDVNRLIGGPIIRKMHSDIVHETYYSARRTASSRSKVVISVFDMIHERFPNCFSPNDPVLREKRLAVERADHVVCISSNTQKDLIEILGVAPEKTSVVHLGLTLTQDGNVTDLRGMSDRPFLLYVGMRGGYKNFETLLRAYANSLCIRREFDLMTFGGGALTTKEQELVRTLGLGQESVRQLSGDDSTLAALYKAATAFVYPSFYEGFGIPPLEAMEFSCPVICSKTSSIPEVVGNAGEYFDPSSVDDLQQTLEQVLYDNERRDILINHGRERIKLYSWERCAMETLEVYSKVLE